MIINKLYNSGKSICLLKTAVAKVTSDTYSGTANILLDEGAQCSFISTKPASTLQLAPYRQDSVALASFGAEAILIIRLVSGCLNGKR